MAISAVGEQYLPARLRPFIFLSHPVERPSHSRAEPSSSILWSRYYVTGPNDFPLIIGWAVIITLLRWIILRQLKKLAYRWLVRGEPSHPPLSDASNINQSVISNTGDVTTAVMTNGHGVSNGNDLTSRKSFASKVGKDTDAHSRHRKTSKALKAALKARERIATRFAEQGFAFIYYTSAWCCGLVSIHASLSFV
jgi:very-long-chain ceramide synthase